MQRFSPVNILFGLLSLTLILFLGGCGGSSSTINSNNSVVTIVLSATTFSLNEGEVVTLTATPEDSSGTVIAADVTYTSSNTAVANVSTAGLICGGAWDASFIVCTPTIGQGGIGTATITATSGKASATATVYVHLKVDRVVISSPSDCTTMAAPVNVSSTALSTSAPGCSPSAPCDITATVGPFTYGSNNIAVVAANSSGVLTAIAPGATSIFSGVSGVNSVSIPYQTCPAASIKVHLSNSSETTVSFNNIGGSLPLTADVFDSHGQGIQPTLTWGTSEEGSVTATGGTPGSLGTITSSAPGTASITAACSSPTCNIGLPAQYSQNVLTAVVSGSTATMAYAASTNSTMLVPIATASNTTSTALTLPNVPNSIAADPAGTTLYLGSAAGLMAVNLTTNTISTYSLNGTIVAVSPNGSFMLISDSVANSVYSFNLTNQTLQYISAGNTTSSSAYTPDSAWNEWVNGTTFVYGLPIVGQSTLPLGYTANALDIIAQGGLTFVTSSGSHEVDVRSTCNAVDVQTLTANAPTLINAIPNGTGAVAADSPNVDVISTPSLLSPSCPTTTPSTIVPFNMNAGPFTAQQMFISSDSSHVWIVSDLPELLSFNLTNSTPSAIPYLNGATAYNGGITLDGTRVFVGTNDGTVHVLDTTTGTDIGTIPVNLKDANSNPVNPNLVLVLHH
jgi:hypothetical protein